MPLRPYDQNQAFLFPPYLSDWICEEHPARVFSDLVDRLDISGFQDAKVEGRPRYHTRMMLKVTLWAYANGIRASRKIEDRLQSDVVFMWLAGLEKPDFHAICDFRRCNRDAIDRLFVEVLALARALGLLRLGLIALDGTKVRASAGINTFKTKADWRKALAEAQGLVASILAEAEAQDQADDQQYGSRRSGREIPKELINAQRRAAKIEQLLLAVGEEVKDTTRISSTDPQARFMHTQTGSVPAYNVQLSVTEDQLIVGATATAEPIDTNQLLPGLEAIKENTGRYPDQVAADAGYDCGHSLYRLEQMGIDGYIPDGAERHLGQRTRNYPQFFGKEQFRYDESTDCYHCPGGQIMRFKQLKRTKRQYGEKEEMIYWAGRGVCLACPLREQCTKVTTRAGRTITRNKYEAERERMREKLVTAAGKETYGKRKCLVEPVNGQLKVVGRLRQFLLRGLSGVQLEVTWSAIAHNLLKLTRRLVEGKIGLVPAV